MYLANGNTLTGGGRVNVWDSQNRLYACTFGGVTTTNTYAADGLRHRMTTGASTTDYVLDGTMAVQELRNGTVAATYLAGPRGPEYRRDDTAGTVRWYAYDGLGSVVGEVAPDGSLTCARKLDVYGCVRSSTGTATSKHKFVGSLGHPSDDETGLIYMRARHYDPVCGRFASEDPARNGANWLRYCSDNPVNAVDRTGEFLDPLFGTLIQDWAEETDGSASAAAQVWAKGRIESLTARFSGELAGWLAASFMDELDYGVTKAGFWICNMADQRLYVDFDLLAGKVSGFGQDGPIKELFAGFWDAFGSAMGLT